MPAQTAPSLTPTTSRQQSAARAGAGEDAAQSVPPRGGVETQRQPDCAPAAGIATSGHRSRDYDFPRAACVLRAHTYIEHSIEASTLGGIPCFQATVAPGDGTWAK